MMTDNHQRLTRRQLLRALVGLTCVDHRAVHPSERMYIHQQQLDEEDEEGRLAVAAGGEQDAADIQLAQAMEEVLPIVLDTAIDDDPRLLVNCATVCTTWRDLCRQRIGTTLSPPCCSRVMRLPLGEYARCSCGDFRLKSGHAADGVRSSRSVAAVPKAI